MVETTSRTTGMDGTAGGGIVEVLNPACTNKAVEREAFALQGQSDAVPLLLEALRRRCR